jgi:altronate dehydratase small subunit
MASASRIADTDKRLLQLADDDNVCVATATIEAGERVSVHGATIAAASRIPIGHKIAIRPIACGEHILKYGMSIGSATRAISPGEHVHTHNLTSDYLPAENENPADSTRAT